MVSRRYRVDRAVEREICYATAHRMKATVWSGMGSYDGASCQVLFDESIFVKIARLAGKARRS